MIELTFGESAAGGLKMAKSMKQGDHFLNTITVISDTEKEQAVNTSREWTGVTMPGSPKDVEVLTLALDIGDISDMDTTMSTRKMVLDDLFADFPGVSDEIWKTNQHALGRIKKAKSTLEPVRMWICTDNPMEQCAMYYICHLLENANTPLSAVYIPKQIQKDDRIVCYHSTGEIASEEFGAFASYEAPISRLHREKHAMIWSDLVRENAPLRAIINGRLVSVPVDFYDFALRANIPDAEFSVAQLIGKALNQVPCTSDRWLFLRIQTMLKSGELLQITEKRKDHPYSAILHKAPN